MAAAPPPIRWRLAVFLVVFASTHVVQNGQAQTTTGNATTDPSEARALNRMFERWGISATNNWNISGELCSGVATNATDVETNNINPSIKCDCSYDNNSICHIILLRVYALNVVGPLPDELWNFTYLTNLETFSLYIHHGGCISRMEEHAIYLGGSLVERHGFDEDRFGYLDLENEVQKLGYVYWDNLFFKLPGFDVYHILKNDNDVMQMLTHLSLKCKILSIYVDCGVNVGDVKSIDKSSNPRVTGEDSDENSEDDIDYMPSECETDDSLSDNDLELEDDEYVDARKNLKNNSVPRDVFDRFVGVSFENINVDVIVDEFHRDGDGVISDYNESDAEVYSSSTEDEYANVKPKRKRVVYDKKCDHKRLHITLGMRFEDGYQAKEALTTVAIENGWPLHFSRVCKTRMEANCTPPCKWRCYGSAVKGSDVFMIRRLTGEHVCPRSMNNKLATSKWIAKQYLNMFRARPGLSIKDLEADILHRYVVRATKWRLYKARWKALEDLSGSVDEHYGLLRRYVAELIRVDREGKFELLLDGEGRFRGLYIGFSALRKGFMKGCRPLLGLDGAFLKTHLGGVLLSAIGKDGNNQMFPVAWAVVEIENEECWTWFLNILFQDLGIIDGGGFTIVSDQQKGLLNAVGNLAPFAEHRNCARHIYCNWKKGHKGATLKKLFWKACKSTNEEEYKLALQELQQEDEAAATDFVDIGPQKFCKAFISTTPMSDMIDNNVSETFNGAIVSFRVKHVIHMLEDIRCYLMERQVKKFDLVQKVPHGICPNIWKKMEKLKFESRHCISHPALGGKFEVHQHEDKFVVHIGNKSCTCREWDLTGIPCIHAISAIYFMKQDPLSFVHDYYSMSKYLEAYKHGLEPLRGQRMWPEVAGDPVKPPPIRKMPGRPKKKRKRDPDEKDLKSSSRIKNIGVTMTCQRCMQTGHNIRTCKNELVPKQHKEKGKRGRPPKSGQVEASIASHSNKPKNTTKSAVRSKCYGALTSNEIGNIYVRMPSQRKTPIVKMAPRGDKSGTHGVSGSITDIPTQESQI